MLFGRIINRCSVCSQILVRSLTAKLMKMVGLPIRIFVFTFSLFDIVETIFIVFYIIQFHSLGSHYYQAAE